jgi:hypothetical protein
MNAVRIAPRERETNPFTAHNRATMIRGSSPGYWKIAANETPANNARIRIATPCPVLVNVIPMSIDHSGRKNLVPIPPRTTVLPMVGR